MGLRLPAICLTAVTAAVPLAFSAAPAEVSHVPAQNQRKIPVSKSPDLWATINVCDTAGQPNIIGIRGSMPGLRIASRLRMRFQVQYLARADGKWHDIETGADSGWKRLGRVRRQVVESGQNFEFEPPDDGGAHRLRGLVRFKWVRRNRVLEREQRFTEAGHRSTAGADPPGYSAAMCDIS